MPGIVAGKNDNRVMPRCPVAALALLLAACSPALNWRDVRDEPSGLHMTFPCKPDHAERPAEIAGKRHALLAMGCEAGGAMFAVLQADLGEPAQLGPALSQWRAASLATIRGEVSREAPFAPRGALGLGTSQRVWVKGTRADGSAVQGQAVYFARGTRVYQAVIYANTVRDDVADTFFTGLSFE
jgi:hypothetical protein